MIRNSKGGKRTKFKEKIFRARAFFMCLEHKSVRVLDDSPAWWLDIRPSNYIYTRCASETHFIAFHINQSILFTKNLQSQMGWKRFSMDAFNARWLKYELTLYAPRCSTTHGRLASRPTATVTFGIGCAKRGSSIITVCRQKEEKVQSNLNIITKTWQHQ